MAALSLSRMGLFRSLSADATLRAAGRHDVEGVSKGP